MNSDLTPVPLEAARAHSALTLMGFITPVRHSFSDGGNEKNQTLLDRFRVLIKDTRLFDLKSLDVKKC